MTQYAEVDHLMHHVWAPETRLPDAQPATRPELAFAMMVVCISALGSIPFLIAWAASGLLQ